MTVNGPYDLKAQQDKQIGNSSPEKSPSWVGQTWGESFISVLSARLSSQANAPKWHVYVHVTVTVLVSIVNFLVHDT